MDHTLIVTAADLREYAERRDSESVIPELIYWLVVQSASQLSECRIPYGDDVNQPGFDGLVQAGQGFRELVPDGVSYWEIGTGTNPQDKATREFRKRTKETSESDRHNATFVFVTPRSSGARGWDEPKQRKWKIRRKNRGWKDIRILDGVKLADWLREFPAIGHWMASKIGLSDRLGGISTPREHWENIAALKASGDPPLPPKLFTEGRSNAGNALQALFGGQSQKLLLFAESPQDVSDFVAAYIETLEQKTARSYADRCLYIKEEDAWRSIVEVRKSHVLVADPLLALETPERADLLTIATRKGHGVIIPLCGAWAEGSPEIIRLRSPSQFQVEAVLKEAGYSDVRSRELGAIGGGMLSALRRSLQGLGGLPPYATWETAALFAQAGLAGKWDGSSPADQSALEKLLGKEYGEWIERLRLDAVRSDSPLIQIDEKWRFIARGEAWNALGNRITDADLERLEETAVTVLGERDPKFDLPKGERFAANIHGKQRKHSRILREGLAETLALVGSRSDALSSCSLDKLETSVARTVRRLLENAPWERWASLNLVLPLLAEAAPNAFLEAVESALKDLDNSLFHELFAQEGGGVLTGENYLTGLLWALEGLAWHSDLLVRVAVILSDLASIDPGGNWANRPSNSLADIFLPWHVQTCASLEKRKVAVEAVLSEHPKVGWELILGLLPHSHGFTSGTHRPTWRNYIPGDWKDTVLRSEYWEQITIYTELATGLARSGTEKLVELIDRLSTLPAPAQENLLEHLVSEEVMRLPETERLVIWERLRELVREHVRYAEAEWAMPADMIAKVEFIANTLAPEKPEMKYHHLFSGRDFDLFDRKGDYEQQRKRLNKIRQEAIQTILNEGGVRAALNFARNVAAAYEVGHALGGVGNEEVESEILPSLLVAEGETEKRFVSGFVWARFREANWAWVDQMLGNDWNNLQKSAFLALLPFEEAVWSRVEHQLGQENERVYWSNVVPNPFGPDRDLTLAIEKLIQFGRIAEAVLCVYRTTFGEMTFKDELAAGALLALLEMPDRIAQVDPNQVVDIIKRLQESPAAGSNALFKIEWKFLPWLDFSSPGSPMTLEKYLASDPAFFAEVIALVFRSKHEDENSAPPNEHRQNLARNAYTLLREWKMCPGMLPDGSLDSGFFRDWLEEAIRMTEETGHGEVAQTQVGQVLTHAPPDPDGLWIHQAVAAALNERTADEMRSGFIIEIFNQRGTHGFTAGEEELKLAQLNREKADALDHNGYWRFATAMRKVAASYDRDAERDSRRNPHEDW